MSFAFLNVTFDLVLLIKSLPLVDTFNVPATTVFPDTDSTVNLSVLNCNVVPEYVNKLLPIVESEVAIGNVPLVNVVSVPNVPFVIPTTKLELLF